MGDGLKLTKDKRHRSSSSLSGVILEGTRSERKLDAHVAIPEVDDQFIIADARCDALQEKIDFIKSLKRRKKLKKRSMTKVTDQPQTPENVPVISVRTQPKKKVSQQAARLRRLEFPPNPTRGYLDPAMLEQHHMIGQIRGNNPFKQSQQEEINIKAPNERTSADIHKPYSKVRAARQQRTRPDGDSAYGQDRRINVDRPVEVACGEDDVYNEYNESLHHQYEPVMERNRNKASRYQTKASSGRPRRKQIHTDMSSKEAEVLDEKWQNTTTSPPPRRRQLPFNHVNHSSSASQAEERPVLELFNKDYPTPQLQQQNTDVSPKNIRKATKQLKKARPSRTDEPVIERLENVINLEQHPPKKEIHHPRRVKYRSRRYEMPTVASQMKQAGIRYYYNTANHTNIPFVISKSTAPSHNIGVNIQQVLNGLKIQQPLSGIPLTIAHHMGLGHVPTYGTKSAAVVPALDHREINAIKVGQRLLRLPSYKYVSYNRLLSLYREGDGMVPRFLRAISRPHYFYTSMYNLATNPVDLDGATSKGHATSQETKQNLATFATLYREYESLNKRIMEGDCEPELEQRKEELAKELAAREQHIRKVVQDYRTSLDADQNLRASASIAEDGYRHSAYKIGDLQ